MIAARPATSPCAWTRVLCVSHGSHHDEHESVLRDWVCRVHTSKERERSSSGNIYRPIQTLFPKITDFPAIRYDNYLSSSCTFTLLSLLRTAIEGSSFWLVNQLSNPFFGFYRRERTFSFQLFSCYNHVFTTDEYCCITRAFRSIRINLCTWISPVDD